MSTEIGSTRKRSIKPLSILLSLALVFTVPAFGESTTTAKVDEKSRTSISRHHVRGGRDKPADVRETIEEHKALVTGTSRDKATTRGGLLKGSPTGSSLQNASLDFWFYDADVVLFNDDDNDGYFHGIDLLFDADTNFLAADVFAVLYLSYQGGPWNEYAETEDFTLFGASSDDEYVIVSELMTGYPTGSYDILIELFDAVDGAFLTSFGPDETSELALLPLEDFDLDAPVDQVVVVVDQGGGGSVDAWLLTMLVLVFIGSVARKIWIHRNDSLVRIDTPAPCWQNDVGRKRKPGNRTPFSDFK